MYSSLFLLSNLINETLSWTHSPTRIQISCSRSCSAPHCTREQFLELQTLQVQLSPLDDLWHEWDSSKSHIPRSHLQLTWVHVQGRLCRHTTQAQGKQSQYANLTDQSQLHIHPAWTSAFIVVLGIWHFSIWPVLTAWHFLFICAIPSIKKNHETREKQPIWMANRTSLRITMWSTHRCF